MPTTSSATYITHLVTPTGACPFEHTRFFTVASDQARPIPVQASPRSRSVPRQTDRHTNIQADHFAWDSPVAYAVTPSYATPTINRKRMGSVNSSLFDTSSTSSFVFESPHKSRTSKKEQPWWADQLGKLKRELLEAKRARVSDVGSQSARSWSRKRSSSSSSLLAAFSALLVG